MKHETPEPPSKLLEALALLLEVPIEQHPSFGPLVRKDAWTIGQLTKVFGGKPVHRLSAWTGLREEDDTFESSSAARVAEVLFGIHPGPRHAKK